MKGKPPPLVLTHPTSALSTCRACGKEVRNMRRHAGTAACSNAARKAMIARLDLAEVWWRDSKTLTAGHVSVVMIRDRTGGKDRRRWYAPRQPVDALRALEAAGISEKAISRLLRGPKDELERELAVAALAGRREEERHASAHAVLRPGGGLQALARSP